MRAALGPWAPAVGGLRNLVGRVDRHGVATIWATTATVSGSDDPGADPNALVAVADPLGATAPPAWQRFVTLRRAPPVRCSAACRSLRGR